MGPINAYLVFDGNCREALTLYRECLGGELSLMAVKDSPMANEWPEHIQNTILHGALIRDGEIMLMATDMVGPEGCIPGNTMSLSLTCSSREELETVYASLSAGGQGTHPPHDFFAGTLGVLIDKFGMHWMLYYDSTQEKPQA